MRTGRRGLVVRILSSKSGPTGFCPCWPLLTSSLLLLLLLLLVLVPLLIIGGELVLVAGLQSNGRPMAHLLLQRMLPRVEYRVFDGMFDGRRRSGVKQQLLVLLMIGVSSAVAFTPSAVKVVLPSVDWPSAAGLLLEPTAAFLFVPSGNISLLFLLLLIGRTFAFVALSVLVCL